MSDPLNNTQAVLGSYVVRINEDAPDIGSDRFAVRNAGVDVLSVNEYGTLRVGGSEAAIKSSSGAVMVDVGSNNTGNAFEFAVGGVPKLTIPHQGPPSLPKVVVRVVTSLPVPPPAAGLLMIHDDQGAYYLCVSVFNGTQNVWHRTLETTVVP